MVYLLPHSPLTLNSKTLKQWDDSVRENFQRYQRDIDKVTYALQRTQRGFTIFGAWFYPAFSQRDLLRLQMLRTKQMIGRINQEEINDYKTINPAIALHLNQSFADKWILPTKLDLGISAMLQVYAHVFNFQYSWRLAFLVGPYLIHSWYTLATHNRGAVPSLEFMNWVVQVRKSQSQLERFNVVENSELLQKYQNATKGVSKPLEDIYQDLIDSAKQYQPNL